MDPKNPYYHKQLQRFAKGDINSDVPDAQDDE
jgi:hypothetical protein